MKNYTKLLALTLLCLLMMPIAAFAGNDAEGTLTSDNATIQGEYEGNNDAHYLDNDDDDGDNDDDDGDNDDDDGDNDDDDGDNDDDDGEDNDDDDGYDDNDDDDSYDDNDDDDSYDDNDDDDSYDDNDDDDSYDDDSYDDDSYDDDSYDNDSYDDGARSNSGTTPAVSSSRTSTSSASSASSGNCQTFSETGHTICDDSNARFLSAFTQYGLQNIGYPISTRFERDGFITQGFQKAVLQWRADSNTVAFVNVFDELHNHGMDGQLEKTWQTPAPLPAGWDGNATFPEVIQKRQALLTRPALQQAYFSASEPLTLYGLPTSRVQDMGNHYAIRLQRAVLQEWKKDVPWAKAGQVTIANGGDIAKQLGYLPQ